MDKADLQKARDIFDAFAKKHQLTVTYTQINTDFLVDDFLKQEEYISSSFPRQICQRISNIYYSWASFLHGLLLPNPSSLIDAAQSEIFTKDQETLQHLLYDCMVYVSKMNTINIDFDEKLIAEYIEQSSTFYKKLQKKLKPYLQRIDAHWPEKKSAKQDEEKPMY